MTDKKKKYDIVNKGVCSYPQTENFVAAKQYLIINEGGKRYLLVRLTNSRAEHVTGATLFVEQYNDRGDKIAADSVRVSGFDGYPQKSFAVEDKILVAPTCVDCRITVTDAEFGKYTYNADDSIVPGYLFEPDAPDKKVPAEIMKRAGKKGVIVEPRSLKMPTLILIISIIMLVAAFVATWIYTDRYISNEEKFLHDGVYYSFVGGDRSDGSDVYVVGVRGSRSEISVPDEIEGHNVARVATGAFLGNKNIKKVSLGGEIAIEPRAFFGCTALESINLKNAISIGEDAFSGCTRLKSVELKDIVNIGDGAFNRCGALTSVKIAGGESDITIGQSAFANCASLRTVDIDRTVLFDAGSYAIFENSLNVRDLHLKNFECGNSSRKIVEMFGDTPALSSLIIDSIDTVGEGLCEELSTVTTVRFNDVATLSIGARAFRACENLTEVILPAAVYEVGDEAFSGSGITSFDGSALISIGKKAFADCKSLSSFVFNKDTELTEISDSAFINCAELKSITIPTEVAVLGERAFSGCGKLAAVTFDDESTIATIGNSVFEDCKRLSSINLPAKARAIGDRAFFGCAALSDVTLPAELAYIGEESFAESGLIEIKLPASVTSIGCGAFAACEKLRALSVPFVGGSREANRYLPYIFGAESVDFVLGVVPMSLKTVTVTDSTEAPNYAFMGCTDIVNAIYVNGLNFIGENAFRDCRSLATIELADVESIGLRAFFGCSSLTQITLPNSVTAIGRNAFTGCTALETLITPFVGASRTSNGFLAYMFGGDAAVDVDKIPASLKKVELTDTQVIGESAFMGTSIREVVISGATTAIEKNAFGGNRKLNVVTLPLGLLDIGKDAFLGCYSLYEVYNFSGLRLVAGEDMWGYVAYYALKVHTIDEARLTVASYDGYDFVESGDNWYLVRYPEEEEELVLPAAVETEEHSFSEYSVYNRLFSENGILTSVHIPSNAKRIGERAFSDCDNLISVTVDNGVATIGSGAFSGCAGLKVFVFPNSVTTVADGIFGDCAELERVTLPAVVDRIGSNAFNKCVSLEKLSIPNDCTEICDGAFGGCIMLYDVNIPSACEQIGGGAFANCRRIKSVTLPTTLKSNGIGVGAFEGCIKLYEVYNLSNLKVLYGSESNGCVGKYAYAVYENAEDLPLDNTIVGGSHYYKLDEQWYLVDYYGADGAVKVSGFTFGGERIDNIIIIDYAFQYYDTIISVVIDEAVSLIGKSAFNACSELNSIEIFAAKLGISDGAFAECEKLTSLTVLSGDVDFGTEAFMLCGLTSVLLVGGDFVVKNDVFYDNTELDALTVDCKSFTVSEMAFFNGLKAAEIKCSGSFTAKYRAFFGSSISELTVEADDVDILEQNFVGYNITEVGIVGYKSVHITSSAFNACGSITSFVLRGKTVDIDGTAFNACNNPYTQSGMGDLSITGEQIDISTSAFSHCIVNSLTIDGAALTLGDGAVDKAIFLGSAIGELSIVYGGESITVGELLNESTLSALNVRGKKVEIADNAFHTEGKLASLDVAAEELTIGTYAFCNQQELKSVVLTAARVAEIGESAFNMCNSLEQLILPAALKTIDNRAFFNCLALKSLNIPQGVTSIGDDAFGYCYALEKLTLPSGLTSIGTQAFRYCNALKSLTLPNTVESVGAAAFYNCKSLERLVLSSAMSKINDLTFCHCESLTAIDLPESLTFVGQNAFADCNTIKSLTIPSGVTQIDDYAFSGCFAMEALDFKGASELSGGAFAGCYALKSLVIPDGTTVVPEHAFRNCVSLTSLTIPNSVTSIGSNAFRQCLSLVELNLPSSLRYIGSEAFGGCAKLKYLELPSSLQSIENNAFNGATSLFAVCNKSGLDIQAGSDEYGGVAKYALVVANSADKINLTYVESGKNKFVRANGVWYLYECEIGEDGMGLPESVTTSAGVINSYIIKSHAFGGWVTWIVIPKSVAGLQDDAFEAGVSNVYYRGTAQEWDEICGYNSIGSIFFYVDCVHNSGEWTEIDGEISKEVTMTAWTVVKDATCTEKGKLERHCERCGKKEGHELAIDPDAHEYDENGKCKHCGAIEPDNDDDADTQTDNEDARSRV